MNSLITAKKKNFGLPAPLWRAVLLAVLAMIVVLGISLLSQWDSSLQFWATLGTGILVYFVSLVGLKER